jgi:hypothetical protein
MYRASGRVFIVVAMSAVAVIVTSAAAGAGGPVATASGKRPLLIGNCKKPQFEPQQVVIACADRGFIVTGITWSAWTKKAATGTGTGQINDCNPSCISGKVKKGPIQLRASKPQTCSNGKRIFSKLVYTWTSHAPVGPDTGSLAVGCKFAGL